MERYQNSLASQATTLENVVHNDRDVLYEVTVTYLSSHSPLLISLKIHLLIFWIFSALRESVSNRVRAVGRSGSHLGLSAELLCVGR